jgi:hypothetical protein
VQKVAQRAVVIVLLVRERVERARGVVSVKQPMWL